MKKLLVTGASGLIGGEVVSSFSMNGWRVIGIDNNKWLQELAKDADLVIAAWGNDGTFMGQSRKVRAMISNLMCLKTNKTGEPAHPLYQPGSAVPIKFSR